MRGLRDILAVLAAAIALALAMVAPARAASPVQTCIAPLDRGSAAQPEFSCDQDQTRFGSGDFAVQLRFAPVFSQADDPLVLRHTSVWQGGQRVVFHYADGTTSEQSFDSQSARRFMTIGAIFEFIVPPRDAALDGIYIETRASANWRGVLIGAELMARSQSEESQRWLVALYAAFGGLSLALLAYNLALYTVLRHTFQLSYSAMVASLMAYTFTSSSLAMKFIPWLDNNDRLRLNYVLLALAAVTAIRFMVDFFGPDVIGRGLRRVMRLIAGLTMLVAVAFALLAPWGGYWLDKAYFIACGASVMLVLPIIHAAWRARVRHLGLFLIAWSAPFVVSMFRTAFGVGLIGHSFWLDNGNLIALSIESLLSTMLIVARLRELSRERDAARASEQSALRLANSDPLTGLLNRRAFIDLAIGRVAPHRLMLVDIDHFKSINDRMGHDAGDEVLRAVAEVLQACRPPDSLAVRLGGEEFALLVPLQHQGSCTPERVLEAVRAKAMPLDWKVTISLGYADGIVTRDEDWRRLYRLADAALYRAKADGRNRACRATDFAPIEAARA